MLSDIAVELQELTESIGADRFHLYLVQGVSKPRLTPCLAEHAPGHSVESAEFAKRLPKRFADKLSETFHPLFWGIAMPDDSSGMHWEETLPLDEGCGLILPLATDQRNHGAIFILGQDIRLERDLLFDLHSQCHALFTQFIERDPHPAESASPAISKRELQCLKLTANGLTSEEIARRLGLSVHTANQYLANTTQKLNAVNRVHAVAKALRKGLID
ncbi:helix-turn-helix domain-containing protein [Nitratireductor sp.]